MGFVEALVSIDELPDDPARLKQLVLDLANERDQLHKALSAPDLAIAAQIAELEKLRGLAEERRQRVLELEARVREYLTILYGRRRERFTGKHPQFSFMEAERKDEPEIVADPAPDEESTEEQEKAPRTRRRGIGRLPQNLPRETQVIDLDESERRCGACDVEMHRVGEDRSERLEYVPASWKIVESVRPRYSCPSCHQGIHTALAIQSPVDGGLPGPGLLAHLVVSKYNDHLPLYRLEQIYARDGVEIARSTMCDWIRDVAQALTPIVEEMKARVTSSYVIHTDDTPVDVIDPSHKGKCRKGRLWVYLGDEGEAVFDFTMSRRRDGPMTFLKKFTGYLQADAFSGYDALFKSEKCVEVACWAHARRRFIKAHEAKDPRAASVLSRIQELYQIEAEATERRLSFSDREALRRKRAIPILEYLRPYLERERLQAVPDTVWEDAVSYSCNQWQALERYARDGRLAIDNNPAERAVKLVAIGRKNWLFAGSEAGGKRAATLYSVIYTCKRMGLDPLEYLRDVLARVAAHPRSKIWELTPRGWMEARGLA